MSIFLCKKTRMSIDQIRNCFIGFFIGDSFGSPYDLKQPRAAEKIKYKNSDEMRDWTENGDIVACVLRNRDAPVTKTISECFANGVPEIGHDPTRGYSSVAKLLLNESDWAANPIQTAEKLAEKGDVAIINLPVTTSLALLGAHRDSIEKYASLFVADKFAGVVTCFYNKAISAAFESDSIDCDELIKLILNTFQNEGKCAQDVVDDAVEYSGMKLSDLNLNKHPIHAKNSLKVICYALRIIEHAHANGVTPNLERVLQHVASGGGDVSSNCAIAASIICAATYRDGIIDTSEMFKRVKNGQWIMKIILRVTGG